MPEQTVYTFVARVRRKRRWWQLSGKTQTYVAEGKIDANGIMQMNVQFLPPLRKGDSIEMEF